MRLSQLTENLSLKIFSLVVAILLFIFVSVESATPVDVDFPIEYRTSEDMMIVGEPPQALHTTLQGPWASFRSFDIDELAPVVVDLTGYGPGTASVSLETSDVSPPAGMTVVAIRPSELQVRLDRKIERLVPVLADTVGSLPVGFELESVSTVPERVRVVGPASALQELEYVYTRSVSLEGRREDFTTEAELRPLPPPLRVKEKRVRVMVQIQQEEATRIIDLPVSVDGAQGVHVTPERVAIKLRGPRAVLDKVEASQTFAYVELPQQHDGTSFEASVKVRGLPERVHLLGQAPRVQVVFAKHRRSGRK